MSISPDQLSNLLLFLPILIFSLTVHEWAHAWSADKLGDSTARYLGRMTINPVSHISPIGTIVFPIIVFLTGAPLLGWANPVPVNPMNLRTPMLKNMAIVSAAGPLSNLILAVVFTALLAMSYRSPETLGTLAGPALDMFQIGVMLNLGLFYFNLLPLYPLDGSRIVAAFAPDSIREKLEAFSQYSQFILIALVVTGGMRFLFAPVGWMQQFLYGIFGLV